MSCHLACLLAGLLGAAEPHAAPARYARPNLLIEPAALTKPEAAQKFRILDVRSLDKYKAGHLPLASTINTPQWSKDFADGPDRGLWEKRLTSLGINTDTSVVVYGDDLRETARVWWILRYWGVNDVRILNGGFSAWKTARGKLHKGLYTEPYYPPVNAKLESQPDRLAIKDDLLESLKKNSLQIADARSRPEYCGEARTANRNGSIPHARHLEWSSLLDSKTQRFKSPAELARLFKAAHIDPDRPTVTYCQSGGRASVLAFALELMGGKDIRNYYRSWAEWGNDEETPIDKPKPKK